MGYRFLWLVLDTFKYWHLYQVNTKYLYNICTLLNQRRRCLADIVQMLYKKVFCLLGSTWCLALSNPPHDQWLCGIFRSFFFQSKLEFASATPASTVRKMNEIVLYVFSAACRGVLTQFQGVFILTWHWNVRPFIIGIYFRLALGCTAIYSLL